MMDRAQRVEQFRRMRRSYGMVPFEFRVAEPEYKHPSGVYMGLGHIEGRIGGTLMTMRNIFISLN